MKIPNIYVYSILAIGMIFSVPTLLDNVQAQMNITNATSSSLQNQTAQAAAAGQNQTAQAAAAGQNQTMSQDAQALMALDIPELKDNLMTVKEALANGEREDALTGITDVENQLLLLQNKTTFTEDIQKIKDSISKTDLKKALDDITNIQNGIIKAETEVFKAQLANPELMAAQQDNDNGEDGN
ncbi:MAG TPA: hypothetical protein VHJ38_10915 [Nitrososphaeraceae archaeon]|nr:hypothetical protein [Nitrososphaeraceae archaeon]